MLGGLYFKRRYSMGTDLIIKYRDKSILNIGRAHYYDDFNMEDVIYDEILKKIDSIRGRMYFLVKCDSINQISEMKGATDSIIDEIVDIAYKAGKASIISEIIKNEDFTLVKE